MQLLKIKYKLLQTAVILWLLGIKRGNSPNKCFITSLVTVQSRRSFLETIIS